MKMESFRCLVWFTETHSPSFDLLQRVFLPCLQHPLVFAHSWKDLSDNLIKPLHCEGRETEAQRPEPRYSDPQTSILPNTVLHLALSAFQLDAFGTAPSKSQDPSLISTSEAQAPAILICGLSCLVVATFWHVPHPTTPHNPMRAHL